MNKQIYSFPIVKNPEIISSLNQAGITCTEDELTNPDKYKDQCRYMLEYLAEHCTGITREEIQQPAFSGLSVLNFPELHEDSIPQMNAFRAVGKMMENCGIYDFSIKDFMNPSSKRLRKQLSGIINFMKFRDERFTVLSELNGTREELNTKLHNLRDKNETLNNRLATLREQTAEESKVITKVELECRSIEENISNLNQKQAEIKEECSDLKALNNQLKDSLATVSLELDEGTALRKKLSAQIVNSPERFRKQIVDVGQALQQEQKDVKAAERKLRDLSGWLATCDEVQIDVDSALETIHDLRSEVEKQKSSINELDSKRHLVTLRRTALEELDQNVHQINRQTTRADEKLQLLRRQASNRGTDTQRQVEELHKRLLDAENSRVQVRTKAERSEGEAQRLEHELQTEGISQEQEREDMVASYRRLERIVVSHLSSIRKVVEDDRPMMMQSTV